MCKNHRQIPSVTIIVFEYIGRQCNVHPRQSQITNATMLPSLGRHDLGDPKENCEDGRASGTKSCANITYDFKNMCT